MSQAGVRIRLDLSSFEKVPKKQFRWTYLGYDQFSTVKDVKDYIKANFLPKLRRFDSTSKNRSGFPRQNLLKFSRMVILFWSKRGATIWQMSMNLKQMGQKSAN